MTDKSNRGCLVDRKNGCTVSRIFLGGLLLKAMLDSDGLAGELAIAENKMAAKIGGFHFATQIFAEVRRDRMTVVQAVFGDYKFGLGIEDDEVGVVSGAEAAFARVAAG